MQMWMWKLFSLIQRLGDEPEWGLRQTEVVWLCACAGVGVWRELRAKFIEKDSDLLDSAFVSLLRGSTDPSERHYKDESIIVQAQVSSRPLRQPSPIPSPDGSLPSPNDDHPRLDPGKTYPVTTQLNFTLSEIFSSFDRTQIWNISCIRPNDSGSSNSFDEHCVKTQVRFLLFPDISSHKSSEFIADYGMSDFCERYVPMMRGSELEQIA